MDAQKPTTRDGQQAVSSLHENEPGPLCLHCLSTVGALDHFCPNCAAPITAHASIDSLGQVYAAGRAYREAASERPRFIVVLGLWLIFAPQIPVLALVMPPSLVSLVSNDNSLSLGGGMTVSWSGGNVLLSLLALAVEVGLLVLYVLILSKVTCRYLEVDPQQNDESNGHVTTQEMAP
ncbi:MAG: hypothetical protein MI741_16120 [Rhodospirillales bacterium]|nr:hypothetical protein [Rhodospirillales bacterium]